MKKLKILGHSSIAFGVQKNYKPLIYAPNVMKIVQNGPKNEEDMKFGCSVQFGKVSIWSLSSLEIDRLPLDFIQGFKVQVNTPIFFLIIEKI